MRPPNHPAVVGVIIVWYLDGMKSETKDFDLLCLQAVRAAEYKCVLAPQAAKLDSMSRRHLHVLGSGFAEHCTDVAFHGLEIEAV